MNFRDIYLFPFGIAERYSIFVDLFWWKFNDVHVLFIRFLCIYILRVVKFEKQTQPKFIQFPRCKFSQEIRLAIVHVCVSWSREILQYFSQLSSIGFSYAVKAQMIEYFLCSIIARTSLLHVDFTFFLEFRERCITFNKRMY